MAQAIIVQKYGGSSVADVSKIKKVAERVAARRREGFGMVVVVSAMGDTTDELLALAKQVTPNPPRRELDMLLTAGERISMALLSMALNDAGTPAISFTGSQSGIITTDDHAQARIVEVTPKRVQEQLELGKVVIVAGYQGVSRSREVTTLGRGGSDTTAVAMAAALDAQACEIYSDVDGVFSADPRVVPRARKLSELTYEEMQDLAQAGAKVLNAGAVEFAKQKGITIHALSTFGGGTGTRVHAHSATATSEHGSERAKTEAVRAVATDVEVALLQSTPAHQSRVQSFLDERGVAAKVLSRPGEKFAWAVPMADLHDGHFESALIQQFTGGDVSFRAEVARVSAVGPGAASCLGQLLEAAHAVKAQVLDSGCQLLSSSIFVEKGRLAEVACEAHRRLVEQG